MEGINAGLQNKPCDRLVAAAGGRSAPRQTVPDQGDKEGLGWEPAKDEGTGWHSNHQGFLKVEMSSFWIYPSGENFLRSRCPIYLTHPFPRTKSQGSSHLDKPKQLAEILQKGRGIH